MVPVGVHATKKPPVLRIASLWPFFATSSVLAKVLCVLHATSASSNKGVSSAMSSKIGFSGPSAEASCARTEAARTRVDCKAVQLSDVGITRVLWPSPALETSTRVNSCKPRPRHSIRLTRTRSLCWLFCGSSTGSRSKAACRAHHRPRTNGVAGHGCKQNLPSSALLVTPPQKMPQHRRVSS